ncbi:MAG: hypothetical protein NT145_07950 [Elusimicrobia bacterium]|nr:hypothetical protein [Elusimicrobiota bacterium]
MLGWIGTEENLVNIARDILRAIKYGFKDIEIIDEEGGSIRGSPELFRKIKYLKETFGKEFISDKWADIMAMAGKDKKSEFYICEYLSKLGERCGAEFVKDNWQTILRLIETAEAEGVDPGSLLEYGLPALKEILTKENLMQIGEELIRYGVDAGDEKSFYYGLFKLRELITGDNYIRVFEGLSRINCSGSERKIKMKDVYEKFTEIFNGTITFDNYENILKDFIEFVFTLQGKVPEKCISGLLIALSPVIKEQGQQIVFEEINEIMSLCADSSPKILQAISDLSNLILKNYGKAVNTWDELIRPVVMTQAKKSSRILEEIKALYDLGALEKAEDLNGLRELIKINGIESYNILHEFLVPGIKDKIISKNLSKELVIVNKYVAEVQCPILDVYKKYLENPEKVAEIAKHLPEFMDKFHLANIGLDAGRRFDENLFRTEYVVYSISLEELMPGSIKHMISVLNSVIKDKGNPNVVIRYLDSKKAALNDPKAAEVVNRIKMSILGKLEIRSRKLVIGEKEKALAAIDLQLDDYKKIDFNKMPEKKRKNLETKYKNLPIQRDALAKELKTIRKIGDKKWKKEETERVIQKGLRCINLTIFNQEIIDKVSSIVELGSTGWLLENIDGIMEYTFETSENSIEDRMYALKNELVKRGFLGNLAKMLGIEETNIALGAYDKIDYENAPKLSQALKFLKENVSRQEYDMYKEYLKAMLEDRVWDFIENKSQKSRIGREIASQNEHERKMMIEEGINVDRWLGGRQVEGGRDSGLRFGDGQFMYYEKSSYEYDPIGDALRAINYLRDIMNRNAFIKDQEAGTKAIKVLEDMGLSVVCDSRNKIARFEVNKKMPQPPKDIVEVMCKIENLERLTSLTDEVGANTKLASDIKISEWVPELKQVLAVLKTNLSKEGKKYIQELEKQRKSFIIRPMKREPGRDLFIGDKTSCCLAMTSTTYPRAMFERLIDEGMNVIEVIDEATGKTMACSWLYISEDEYLTINNMEIHREYGKIAPLKETVGEEMIKYAQRFAKYIGAKKFIVGKPGHGEYIDYVAKKYKNKLVELPEMLGKIGGSIYDIEYYLDSATKTKQAYIIKDFEKKPLGIPVTEYMPEEVDKVVSLGKKPEIAVARAAIKGARELLQGITEAESLSVKLANWLIGKASGLSIEELSKMEESSFLDTLIQASISIQEALAKMFELGKVEEKNLTDEERAYGGTIQSRAEKQLNAKVNLVVSDNPDLIPPEGDAYSLSTIIENADGSYTIYVHRAFFKGLKNKKSQERKELLEQLAIHEIGEYEYLLANPGKNYQDYHKTLAGDKKQQKLLEYGKEAKLYENIVKNVNESESESAIDRGADIAAAYHEIYLQKTNIDILRHISEDPETRAELRIYAFSLLCSNYQIKSDFSQEDLVKISEELELIAVDEISKLLKSNREDWNRNFVKAENWLQNEKLRMYSMTVFLASEFGFIKRNKKEILKGEDMRELYYEIGNTEFSSRAEQTGIGIRIPQKTITDKNAEGVLLELCHEISHSAQECVYGIANEYGSLTLDALAETVSELSVLDFMQKFNINIEEWQSVLDWPYEKHFEEAVRDKYFMSSPHAAARAFLFMVLDLSKQYNIPVDWGIFKLKFISNLRNVVFSEICIKTMADYWKLENPGVYINRLREYSKNTVVEKEISYGYNEWVEPVLTQKVLIPPRFIMEELIKDIQENQKYEKNTSLGEKPEIAVARAAIKGAKEALLGIIEAESLSVKLANWIIGKSGLSVEELSKIEENSLLDTLIQLSISVQEALAKMFELGKVDEEKLTNKEKTYVEIIRSHAEKQLNAKVNLVVSDNPDLIPPEGDAYSLSTIVKEADGSYTIYVHRAFLKGLENKTSSEREELLEQLAVHEIGEYKFLQANPGKTYEDYHKTLAGNKKQQKLREFAKNIAVEVGSNGEKFKVFISKAVAVKERIRENGFINSIKDSNWTKELHSNSSYSAGWDMSNMKDDEIRLCFDILKRLGVDIYQYSRKKDELLDLLYGIIKIKKELADAYLSKHYGFETNKEDEEFDGQYKEMTYEAFIRLNSVMKFAEKRKINGEGLRKLYIWFTDHLFIFSHSLHTAYLVSKKTKQTMIKNIIDSIKDTAEEIKSEILSFQRSGIVRKDLDCNKLTKNDVDNIFSGNADYLEDGTIQKVLRIMIENGIDISFDGKTKENIKLEDKYEIPAEDERLKKIFGLEGKDSAVEIWKDEQGNIVSDWFSKTERDYLRQIAIEIGQEKLKQVELFDKPIGENRKDIEEFLRKIDQKINIFSWNDLMDETVSMIILAVEKGIAKNLRDAIAEMLGYKLINNSVEYFNNEKMNKFLKIHYKAYFRLLAFKSLINSCLNVYAKGCGEKIEKKISNLLSGVKIGIKYELETSQDGAETRLFNRSFSFISANNLLLLPYEIWHESIHLLLNFHKKDFKNESLTTAGSYLFFKILADQNPALKDIFNLMALVERQVMKEGDVYKLISEYANPRQAFLYSAFEKFLFNQGLPKDILSRFKMFRHFVEGKKDFWIDDILEIIQKKDTSDFLKDAVRSSSNIKRMFQHTRLQEIFKIIVMPVALIAFLTKKSEIGAKLGNLFRAARVQKTALPSAFYYCLNSENLNDNMANRLLDQNSKGANNIIVTVADHEKIIQGLNQRDVSLPRKISVEGRLCKIWIKSVWKDDASSIEIIYVEPRAGAEVALNNASVEVIRELYGDGIREGDPAIKRTINEMHKGETGFKPAIIFNDTGKKPSSFEDRCEKRSMGAEFKTLEESRIKDFKEFKAAENQKNHERFVNGRYFILSASVKGQNKSEILEAINTLARIGAVNIRLRDLSSDLSEKDLEDIVKYCHDSGVDILSDLDVSDIDTKADKLGRAGFNGFELDLSNFEGDPVEVLDKAMKNFKSASSIITIKLKKKEDRALFKGIDGVKFVKFQGTAIDGKLDAEEDECLFITDPEKVKEFKAGMVEIPVESLVGDTAGFKFLVFAMGVDFYQRCKEKFAKLKAVFKTTPEKEYDSAYMYEKEDLPDIELWIKIKELLEQEKYSKIKAYLTVFKKDLNETDIEEVKMFAKDLEQAGWVKERKSYARFGELSEKIAGYGATVENIVLFMAFIKAVFEMTLIKDDLLNNTKGKWMFSNFKHWKLFGQILLKREFLESEVVSKIDNNSEVVKIIDQIDSAFSKGYTEQNLSKLFDESVVKLTKMTEDGVPGAMSGLIKILRVYSDSKIQIKIEKMHENTIINSVKDMLGAA